jgi:hypothetical protein
MKKTLSLLLLSIFFAGSVAFSQESDDKSYGMVELSFMKAKMGKSDEFEKGVKEHNEKYHADGKYKAWMDVIVTGESSGTYVWLMGPCMLGDLDDRPGKGAHNDDWSKNVEPFIESYGATEYWKMNKKLSYLPGEPKPGIFTLWVMDIERGEYYRFKELMSKVKTVYEKTGTEDIRVLDNMFITGDGRDVVMVFHDDSWKAMDDDEWSLKADYEKEFGEGTWQLLIEEWEEVVKSIDRQVWKTVK